MGNTKKTTISIVTPSFNQGRYIRQTIESILSQDYPYIDYWVLDGGSTDETLSILKEYEGDKRFHWRSQKDNGQSDALNQGLELAQGEVFNWINSDDYLAPGALKKIAEAFDQGDTDIVGGRTVEFFDDPYRIHSITRLSLRGSAEESLTVGVYSQQGAFWRTSIMRELGGIEESIHCMMDWHLWARYLIRYGQKKVKLIEDRLAFFRQHDGAKSTKDSDIFHNEANQIFYKIAQDLKGEEDLLEVVKPQSFSVNLENFRVGEEFVKERYWGKFCERLVRIHRKKNKALAKKWLRRSFDFSPRITLWKLKMALRLWRF